MKKLGIPRGTVYIIFPPCMVEEGGKEEGAQAMPAKRQTRRAWEAGLITSQWKVGHGGGVVFPVLTSSRLLSVK
jgi:hypothetical protein